MGLLRYAGSANSAAAGRRVAAQPAQALALIGIALENSMTLTEDYFAINLHDTTMISRLHDLSI